MTAKRRGQRAAQPDRGFPRRTAASGAARASYRRWTVILVSALVVFLLALFALASIFFAYHEGQKTYDDVAEEAFLPDSSLSDVPGATLADLSVDWDALLAVNPDTVGWICIPGTNVNYPIVRAPESDSDKYLTVDFQGNSGGWWQPAYGTPYLLAQNAADFSDRNNIVQGHHLQNGEMFAAIADFADAEQFNAHRAVYLLTPAGNWRLQSVSLVHCSGSEPIVQTKFESDAAFTSYVADKISRSIVECDPAAPDASAVSRFFMFSTCDSNTDARYVLCCVPVEYAAVNSSGTVPEGSVANNTNNTNGGSDGTSMVDPNAAATIDDAAKEIVS